LVIVNKNKTKILEIWTTFSQNSLTESGLNSQYLTFDNKYFVYL